MPIDLRVAEASNVSRSKHHELRSKDLGSSTPTNGWCAEAANYLNYLLTTLGGRHEHGSSDDDVSAHMFHGFFNASKHALIHAEWAA
jgi:hypothetical protein